MWNRLSGAPIRWFSPGEDSKFALISKHLLRSSVFDPPTSNREHGVIKKDEAPLAEKMMVGRGEPGDSVSGMWDWQIQDEKVRGEGVPQGFLTFKDVVNGKLSGHSTTLLGLLEPALPARVLPKIAAFEGTRMHDTSGRTLLKFHVQHPANTTLESDEAFLDGTGLDSDADKAGPRNSRPGLGYESCGSLLL